MTSAFGMIAKKGFSTQKYRCSSGYGYGYCYGYPGNTPLAQGATDHLSGTKICILTAKSIDIFKEILKTILRRGASTVFSSASYIPRFRIIYLNNPYETSVY